MFDTFYEDCQVTPPITTTSADGTENFMKPEHLEELAKGIYEVTTPSPQDWKNDKMKQFMSVLATRDNYVTRNIEGAKSILPMAQEAISDLLLEEREEAFRNGVEVGQSGSASLTHNI